MTVTMSVIITIRKNALRRNTTNMPTGVIVYPIILLRFSRRQSESLGATAFGVEH